MSEEPPELVVALAVWCVFVSFFVDSPGIVPVICKVNTFACGGGNRDENIPLDAMAPPSDPRVDEAVSLLVSGRAKTSVDAMKLTGKFTPDELRNEKWHEVMTPWQQSTPYTLRHFTLVPRLR